MGNPDFWKPTEASSCRPSGWSSILCWVQGVSLGKDPRAGAHSVSQTEHQELTGDGDRGAPAHVPVPPPSPCRSRGRALTPLCPPPPAPSPAHRIGALPPRPSGACTADPPCPWSWATAFWSLCLPRPLVPVFPAPPFFPATPALRSSSPSASAGRRLGLPGLPPLLLPGPS